MLNHGLQNSIICRANAGVALAAAASIAGGTLQCAAQVDNSEISVRRASERTNFSDEEIKDGFFKTAFHAELQFDRRGDPALPD